MIYHCGHRGCDVCGSRECAGMRLTKYGDILACNLCVIKALKLAIHVSETFSTEIDPSKPCGSMKLEDEVKQ
jgi:hypothetical protein